METGSYHITLAIERDAKFKSTKSWYLRKNSLLSVSEAPSGLRKGKQVYVFKVKIITECLQYLWQNFKVFLYLKHFTEERLKKVKYIGNNEVRTIGRVQ